MYTKIIVVQEKFFLLKDFIELIDTKDFDEQVFNRLSQISSDQFSEYVDNCRPEDLVALICNDIEQELEFVSLFPRKKLKEVLAFIDELSVFEALIQSQVRVQKSCDYLDLLQQSLVQKLFSQVFDDEFLGEVIEILNGNIEKIYFCLNMMPEDTIEKIFQENMQEEEIIKVVIKGLEEQDTSFLDILIDAKDEEGRECFRFLVGDILQKQIMPSLRSFLEEKDSERYGPFFKVEDMF